MKNSLNLVLVILFFIVLGCNCQKFQEAMKEAETNSTTSSTPVSTNSSPTSSKTGGLTLEKYNKIEEGMSYRQVADILGSDGVEQMSSGTGKYKVTSYKWEGDQYAFITVIFTGDKMTSKVQYGMK